MHVGVSALRGTMAVATRRAIGVVVWLQLSAGRSAALHRRRLPMSRAVGHDSRTPPCCYGATVNVPIRSGRTT